MPEIYDAEGNVVGTSPEGQKPDEYVKGLAEKAKVAEGLEAEKKKLEEEKTKLEAEKKEMEADINPNWKTMREKEKSWIEKEKDYQKKLVEAGVKGEEKQVSSEEVGKIATQTAKEVFVNEHKDKVLSQFNEKDRQVVEHYFNKLSAGETLTTVKVDELVEAAAKAAGLKGRMVNPLNRAISSFGSAEPNLGEEVSPVAKEMASDLGVPEEELKKGGEIKIGK